MTQTTLTALYDTRAAADTAAERLVTEAGLARSDIAVTAQEAGAAEDGGFLASLKAVFVPAQDRNTYAEAVRRGGFLLTARVEQGSAERAMDILEEHGAVDLDDRQQSWCTEGLSSQQATGAAATLADGTVVTAAVAAPQQVPATAPAAAPVASRSLGDDEKIELVEETLRVGKRAVGGGRVRVRSYVVETPVEEQVNLRQERVDIERRPVDRPVEPGDAVFQEKVIEASERGEEAVVDKQARVVEEVGIRK